MNPDTVQFMIFDARGNGDKCICPTITGGHEISISDYTAIVVVTNEVIQQEPEGEE